MKTKLLAAAPLFIAALLAIMAPQTSGAASFREQGIHHKEGVSCKDCHTVEKPKDAPNSSKTCLSCHGPYEKIAQRTKKLHANPHDSHLGPMDCLKCHGVHEPIEAEKIPCMECHNDFEFKVK
jgi:nitrate/TMAO reductase-like tetraheme cytochrome c subunit